MIASRWHRTSDHEHTKNHVLRAFVESRGDRVPLVLLGGREHDKFNPEETNVRMELTAHDCTFDVRRICHVGMGGIMRMWMPVAMRMPMIVRISVAM